MFEHQKTLLFITLSLLSCKAACKSPLYCDTPIKDIGKIQEGEKFSHAFIVKNVTESNIIVSRVLTSCGCITPLKKNLKLKAGEQVEVPIEFNSMGYGGKKLKKDIYLFVGGELNKPSLTLTITGQITGIPPQERIIIIPKTKSIFNDVGKRYHITISGPADKNLEISAEGPEWLDVKIGKPEKHQELHINQWDLECSLNKKLKKYTKGEIVITTSFPLFEKLLIPIYVEPKPMVIATPPVLFIKKGESDEISAKELEIKLLENSTSINTKQNNTRDTKLTRLNEQEVKNSKISVDTDTLPILIEPSNDCLAVKLLTISNDLSKMKYKISLENCPLSQLSLRIMVGKTCLQKVPICFVPEHIK